MRREPYLRVAISALAFIFLVGNRSHCNNDRPSIDCSSNLSVTVLRGTCAQFNNNCGDNLWVVGDMWETDENLPSGVILHTSDPPNITRRLCASDNAEVVTNQPFSFTYARNGSWGEGTLHLTTGFPLTVSVSSNPSPPVISAGGSVQLLATVAGGALPYSYRWTPSSGLSNPGVANPTASPGFTTTYTVMVNDSVGFQASTSIEITVGLHVSATANPSVIGPGQASQLVANVFGGTGPYTYSWSPADSLDSPASATPVARPAVNTIYNVTVRDAFGAQATSQATVTVNLVVTASATPPQIPCGNPSQLQASVQGGTPPYSYSWSPAAGLSATNIANPTATPQSTTTYNVRVTDAAGATALGSAAVNVTGTCGGLTVSVTASVPLPITINVGDTIGLFATASSGTAPYTFLWTPATGLSSTQVPNPSAGPFNTTSYVVTVTDARGATASASILIVVRLVTSADASPTVISPGQSSQLRAFTLGGMPPITFAWMPPSSLDNPTSSSPLASPSTTTTYTVLATDAMGLQASASTTVQVLPGVTVTANPPSIVRGSSSTLLASATGGSPPFTYLWSPSAGLSATNVPSPTATPSAATTYSVTVTDALGAAASGNVILTVTP